MEYPHLHPVLLTPEEWLDLPLGVRLVNQGYNHNNPDKDYGYSLVVHIPSIFAPFGYVPL